MFPLSDDNPRALAPIVTGTIIAVCVAVFLWQLSLGPLGEARAYFALGMIPARLFGEAELSQSIAAPPAWLTVLTSMFMHGGWLHLGGNMLYLWIFGDNVEDSMGRARFAAFYALCGAAAAMTQALIDPSSRVPMVGASGAIAGVLGAYLLLHPRATVRTLIFFGLITIVHVPAVIVLGVWFLLQLWSAASTPVGEPGVAFWAHVGGFVAGMALVVPFKQRGVRLLQAPRSRAFEQERVRGPWG
jgi:membrane associated rhomboid family serine protease